MWGWNTNGELGLTKQESKVVATPTLIDFTNDQDENIEVSVKKVQCGNTFTICMTGIFKEKKKKKKKIVISEKNVLQKFTFPTDDGTLWGCGCNKYGQLGQSPEKLSSSPKFVKLDVPLRSESIKDFKCYEWGTVLVTD